MTTTRDAVRVDSPGALCAMLPHLCGFTPSESLALVWMHGGSVVVTQRIDVDALDLDTAALAATIPASVVVESDRLAAVIVSDARTVSPDDVDRLTAALDQAAPGVEVLDVLHIRHGRWSSLLCDNPECCPPDGTPLDPDAPAVVEMIARGSAPEASRAVAVEPWATGPDSTPRLPALPTGAALESWRDTVLADPLAFDLADVLRDVRVRDVVLWQAARGDLDALDVLAACRLSCADTHPLDVAPVATVGACLLWSAGGSTARAGAALTTAQAAEPDYSLALLVAQSMAAGLPPAVWADAMRSLDFRTVRHGSDA